MSLELILASSSPQRQTLLAAAGYNFRVLPPADTAEDAQRPGETAAEMVVRLAWQKAADVAPHVSSGIVIACDTVAECAGQILGKPVDRQHARQMLQWLSGREHQVLSGLCVWPRPGDIAQTKLALTTLRMETLAETRLDEYLDSGLWRGKAAPSACKTDRVGCILSRAVNRTWLACRWNCSPKCSGNCRPADQMASRQRQRAIAITATH